MVANLLAVMIGALVGLASVGVGAWLQARREQARWVRDQRLRAATDFLGATGGIYDRRRRPPEDATIDDGWEFVRAHNARSALYLLCHADTMRVAEELFQMARSAEPTSDDSPDRKVVELLRDLNARLRRELGAMPGS